MGMGPGTADARMAMDTVMGRKTRRAQHRRAPGSADRGTGLRAIVFGLLSVVIMATAAVFLWPVLKPINGSSPDVVTVQVSMSGFSPARISTRTGVPLTLRFVNNDSQSHTDGGGWHQFAIDDLGVDVRIAPRSTREVTITPESSGDYEFYCDVCCGGKENPSMVGALAVGDPV